MILAVIRVPASVACSCGTIAIWCLRDHPSITSSLLETVLTPFPTASSFGTQVGGAYLMMSCHIITSNPFLTAMLAALALIHQTPIIECLQGGRFVMILGSPLKTRLKLHYLAWSRFFSAQNGGRM